MEILTIRVMGVIIATLVGAFITRIIADKKYTELQTKIDNIEHMMIKILSKLDDVDVLKSDANEMFTRLREVESKVSVLESKV